MKRLILIPLIFLLMGCSQDKIKSLEARISNLEKEKSRLIIQNNELKALNEDLQSYVYKMQNDIREINRYANSASQNANNAAFWFQAGDSFLYQNCLREMSNDFNAIARITSKY